MRRALVVIGVLLMATTRASAQDDAPALRAHRFTLSGGLTLLGGYDIGSNTAALRRNETGTTTPSPLTLFNAAGAVERVSGVEARLGFSLTRTVAVELGGSYSRPRVAVDITNDSEAGDAPRLTDQRLSQYVIDVSGLWQLPKLNLGNRARPYVTAGGGYLRQLDVDRVNAETGMVFHTGAGVRYWLRGADGLGRALGIRAEARAQFRSGGIDFEGKTRVAPVLNVFGFVGF